MLRSFAAWSRIAAALFIVTACAEGGDANGDGKPKAAVNKAAHTRNISSQAKGPPSPITLGQSVNGALDASDAQLGDQSHYDTWIYQGRAGETITITMQSTAFDAYLILGRESGGQFRAIQEDDDGAGDLNARITAQLPENGEYVILANSFGGGATGAYTLRVEAGQATAGTTPATAAQPGNWASRYPGNGDPNERYALLVGVDNYQGIGNSLNGPVADARLIGRILVERYGFRPQNVVTITDREATREHVLEAFIRHLGQAGPNGAAVFYYSGHGMQMDSNYALGASLDPEADRPRPVDEALYLWSDNGRGGVILDDELGFLADRLQTNRVLFIVDACFSGTGTRDIATGQAKIQDIKLVRGTLSLPTTFLTDTAQGTRTASDTKGVEELMSQPQRHILLAASADNEVSWTASGWPKYGGTISVFTYYLAEALEERGQTATFADIMSGVRSQTVSYTNSRYRRTQTPQTEGRQSSTRIRDFLAARR